MPNPSCAIAPVINGRVPLRAQNFSSSLDLSSENIEELTNCGFVAVQPGTPEHTVSMETLEHGNISLLGLLLQRLPNEITTRKVRGGSLTYNDFASPARDQLTLTDATEAWIQLKNSEGFVVTTVYKNGVAIPQSEWKFINENTIEFTSDAFEDPDGGPFSTWTVDYWRRDVFVRNANTIDGEISYDTVTDIITLQMGNESWVQNKDITTVYREGVRIPASHWDFLSGTTIQITNPASQNGASYSIDFMRSGGFLEFTQFNMLQFAANRATDILVLERDDILSTNNDRAQLITKIFPTSIESSFDVGGNATFSWEGSSDDVSTWYKNIWADSRLEMHRGTGGTTITVDFPSSTSAGPDGRTGLIYVSVNDVVSTTAIFSPAGSSTLDLGTTVTSDDVIKVVYFPADPSNAAFPALTAVGNPPLLPAATSKCEVDIYLWENTGNGEFVTTNWGPVKLTAPLTELQTVSISADLSREDVEALSECGFVERALTTPIEVTVSMSMLAEDIGPLAAFAEKINEFNADTLKSVSIDDIKGRIGLEVIVYGDREKTVPLTRIRVPNISPSSTSRESSVGESQTESWDFTSSNIFYAALDGIYQ